MAKTLPWYLKQRAESLAYVFLTSDPTISLIEERGLDFGIDYKLVLDPRSQRPNWIGVQVRAVDTDPPEPVQWNRPGLASRFFEKTSVPLFLLVVNARDERYFFAWIKEPVIGKTVYLRSHLKESALSATAIDGTRFREHLTLCRQYFRKRKSKTGNFWLDQD